MIVRAKHSLNALPLRNIYFNFVCNFYLFHGTYSIEWKNMHINSDQRHKQELFMELFMPVNRNISNYCRAIANNNEEAKDLLSETLLIAYKNFDKLRDRKAFKYYLFGIASRLYKRKLRRKKFREVLHEDLTSEFPDERPNPEFLLELNDLNDALKQLPLKQKEAVVLFEISGFSLKEIKELQGGSISGVKSRIKRGREKLAEILEHKPEIKNEYRNQRR